MGGTKEGGERVYFTLGDAFRLGCEQIRRRKDRAAINIASIALGISFLATLMFTNAFYRSYAQAGGTSLAIENYQFWLVFVALAVSVVGIANAMLIAVYERFREIGTLKCLGALDQHILQLFLVESLVQGLAGGAVGLAVGLLAALATASFTTGLGIVLDVPMAESLSITAGSMILSVVLSISATLYPAYRAARLKPVEALRYEF